MTGHSHNELITEGSALESNADRGLAVKSLSGSRRWLIIALTIRESRESRFIDEPTGPSFSRRAAGPARRDRLRRARFCHRCPPLRAVHARRSAATHSARRPAWTRAAGED